VALHVPNMRRIRNHATHGSDDSYGNNGAFLIPLSGDRVALCIVSDGGVALDTWEHVSVSIREGDAVRTPTWDEMCTIKGTFWDAADCVVQFHPPRAVYVNTHPHTLHLWRSVTYRQPLPPTWMV